MEGEDEMLPSSCRRMRDMRMCVMVLLAFTRPSHWLEGSNIQVINIIICLQVDNFTMHFKCAQQLEGWLKERIQAANPSLPSKQARKIPTTYDQRVIWLFAADSMALRRDVLKRFGSSRVLVILPETGGKVVVGHVMKGKSKTSAEYHVAVLRSTAGEQWLLSLADYHIFGVTGECTQTIHLPAALSVAD